MKAVGEYSSDRSDDVGQMSSAYGAPLRRFFRRNGLSPDQADDMVQDVFMRLMTMSNRAEIENPQAFVFRIATNLLTDSRRRAASRQADRHDDFQDDAQTAEEISPERVLIAKQELDRLKTLILALPPKSRSVFLLHRFEGLKYREIGQALGMSISAVEKHMMFAIARLARREDR